MAPKEAPYPLTPFAPPPNAGNHVSAFCLHALLILDISYKTYLQWRMILY